MFDRTKPYNELPVLPPKLKDGLSTEVLLLLAEATHSIGKLEGISQKLPNPLMLVNTIALREAKASSEIENIFTTDDELYKASLQQILTFHQQQKRFYYLGNRCGMVSKT